LAQLIKAEGDNSARAKCVGIAGAFCSNRWNVGAGERENAKEDPQLRHGLLLTTFPLFNRHSNHSDECLLWGEKQAFC
jgi:hypothetical protein